MFVEIVTELESCYIYKTVLLTIKVADRNVSRTKKHESKKLSIQKQSTA
jgi:hypothetical protein